MRWTIPGRSSPPIPRRSRTCASSAFTSVPASCPGAGCTTSPAGLSITTSQRSSWTTVSGIASASIVVATGGGGVQTTTSPGFSFRDGVPAAPLTVTAASPIWRASCERDTSATLRDRNRSSRWPAASAATTKRRDASPAPRSLPDARSDVRARLHQHVDQRAVVDAHVKISGVTRLLYSARPSSISSRITSNSESFSMPLDQLLLVIERQVGRDRARQLPRPFGLSMSAMTRL